MKEIEMIGKTFGRLTVIETAPRPNTVKNKDKYWRCRCDCQKEVVVRGSKLRDGQTKSCGCLARERRIERNTKHGMRKTRLYRIYRSMITRCYNANHKRYKYYGGREIKICNEWLDKENGFQNFMEWSLANGYADNLSIDRICNDGNYSPNNCRWADNSVQGFNRRIPKNNKTGHIGIDSRSNGKYRAKISKNKKLIHLGTFDTYEEAVEARQKAERELYPEPYPDTTKEKGHIADGDTPQNCRIIVPQKRRNVKRRSRWGTF